MQTLLLSHLVFRQFRKSAEGRWPTGRRLPVSWGSSLSVQPLTVAQGRAHWTRPCHDERRPQCLRPNLSLAAQNPVHFTENETAGQAAGEPEIEGNEDECQLEEVELAAGGDCYVVPSYSNFLTEWDRLWTSASITETFALSSMESIKGVS